MTYVGLEQVAFFRDRQSFDGRIHPQELESLANCDVANGDVLFGTVASLISEHLCGHCASLTMSYCAQAEDSCVLAATILNT